MLKRRRGLQRCCQDAEEGTLLMADMDYEHHVGGSCASLISLREVWGYTGIQKKGFWFRV